MEIIVEIKGGVLTPIKIPPGVDLPVRDKDIGTERAYSELY